MAVIAVVFMAHDDEVRRLGDRLVSPRVRRSIRVEDDPQAFGFDEECCVAVPGDAQAGTLPGAKTPAYREPVCYDIRPSGPADVSPRPNAACESPTEESPMPSRRKILAMGAFAARVPFRRNWPPAFARCPPRLRNPTRTPTGRG